MDLLADELGIDPVEIRRRNFLPPDSFPYDNPSGLLTAVNGSKLFIDSGNYEPALDKALAMAGYADTAAKKAEAKARGKLLGVGLSTYIEVCGVAPVQVDRRRRRGLGRRDVGVVQHQGPPDRQDGRHDGHPAPGPGPRDDLRADHQPRAGHPDGGHRHPAQRHAGHAVRLRLLRVADVQRGHRRRAQGRRQDPREGAPVRGAHARGRASTTSRSTAPSTGSRAAPTRRRPSRRSRSRSTSPSTRRRAWSPTSTRRPTTTPPTARSRSGRTSRSWRSTRRPGVVDLVRYVAVDDVGKKINPMIVDGQLHGGIAQGVGQALWEERRLRRRRPAALGLAAGLRAPAGVLAAGLRAGRDRHPVAGQPAGRQGRRRGRLHRIHRRRGQRRHRRAQPARHPPSRHAVHGTEGLGRHPGREGRPGMTIPAAFGYTRAGSVDEALRTLAADDGAKVIAGGQSLLPLMKLRLAQPGHARGHRAAGRAARHLASSTTAGWPSAPSRRTRSCSDSPADALRRAQGRPADDRGRPGAQPRDRGRLRRPRGSQPRTCRRCCSRSTRSSCSSRRAARGRSRPTGSSRARSRRASSTTSSSRPVILPAPRDNAGSAYASLEQPASGYAMVGVAAVVIVGAGRPDRVGGRRDHRRRRPPLPRDRRSSRRSSAPTAPPRSWPPRPPTPSPGRRSTRTSTPGASTGPRWRRCTRGGRSRRRSPAPADAGPRTGTSRVRLERIVPGRTPPAGLAGAILTRDLTVAGHRLPKGSRLTRGGPRATRPPSRRARPVTVLVPDPWEVHEDEAALRLAEAVARRSHRADPARPGPVAGRPRRRRRRAWSRSGSPRWSG